MLGINQIELTTLLYDIYVRYLANLTNLTREIRYDPTNLRITNTMLSTGIAPFRKAVPR